MDVKKYTDSVLGAFDAANGTGEPYVADENGTIDERVSAAIQLRIAKDRDERQAELDARRKQHRIEALRAASRIVAGLLSTGPAVRSQDGIQDVEDNTLELAEQFAKWLETGER